MEPVSGLPLVEFCDRQRLSTNARLQLFQEVCEAVQHAHFKGIIHRDLKPSNILVADGEGKPAPKVIDFGISRVIEPDRERAYHTHREQWIGTFPYMSPEQAGHGEHGVDSRADIYSLGVLLYELLTGDLPFGREAMRRASLDEYRRTLREQAPPPPSSRVRRSDSAGEPARNHATEPGALSRTLKGELDWITMKALAPEREQRYSSAVELAADLGRYLRHEPVLAGRPSTSYRLRKFVRRNRLLVAAAAVVLAAWLIGGVITTMALFEARDQRDEATLANQSLARSREDALRSKQDAEQERDAAQAAEQVAARAVGVFTDLLALANPENASSTDSRAILERTASRVASVFAGRPHNEATARRRIAEAYAALSDYEKSFEHLRRALQIVDELEDVSQLERYEVLFALQRIGSSPWPGR